jgi:two-component system sensor histidine kinase AlgZ
MSPPGAASTFDDRVPSRSAIDDSPRAGAAAARTADTPAPRAAPARPLTDDFFIPNFCDGRMVLGVVLMAELIALIFALVRPAEAGFLTDFARISVLMQWLGLTSATVLCLARRPLRRLSTATASLAVLGLVLLTLFLVSVAIVRGGYWLVGGSGEIGEELAMFPAEFWPFVLRNLLIGAIVTGLLLRYFFVSHQWRHTVRAEARSRVDALQARIRPHFLFNSMNTIASLTRSDPQRAEEAVEDLADLFRASLSDADRLLSLKEELELTRIYQRIESLRLGERLRVIWDVAELPMRARVPGLTIQPLLENAIHHGIEPMAGGGTVTIHGARDGDRIRITVSNPTPPRDEAGPRRGHRIAVDNIRERLRLAFAGEGSLMVSESEDGYQVTVSFPQVE